MLFDESEASAFLNKLLAHKAFVCKGPKMALARWMSWLHCWEYWKDFKSVRLLIFWYLGISLGYINHAPSTSTIHMDRLPPATDSVDKVSVNDSQAQLNNVKDKCKKITLHIATLILADAELSRQGEVIHALCRGIVTWHSQQCKDSRDPDANLLFYQRQVSGDLWPSIAHGIQSLSSEATLTAMGFIIQPPPAWKK
jgi:hypothetical protein